MKRLRIGDCGLRIENLRIRPVPLALVLLFVSACTSIPISSDASLSESVRAYYRSVENDRAMPVRELRRRLKPAPAFVEPIGWTVSGVPFANVVSGDLLVETRVMPVPPYARPSYRRSSPMTITLVRIRATDLPEYFESIGAVRPGFASIQSDLIFLDERHETDPLIFEETIEHEFQHILDRPRYETLSPEDLEIRGMIRGMSHAGSVPVHGRIATLNRDRLYYALTQGEPQYRAAARRILEALSIVILGRIDFEALRDVDGEALRNAAAVLATTLGL